VKESNLTKSIKAYLGMKQGLFFWKEHGSMYGTGGVPDLIVCYKGRFVALECKTMGKKPTVLQQITIKKIKRAGGIAACVWSLEEVKAIIEAIE